MLSPGKLVVNNNTMGSGLNHDQGYQLPPNQILPSVSGSSYTNCLPTRSFRQYLGPATPTASQPDPSASIWVQLHQLPPNQILPPVSGSSYTNCLPTRSFRQYLGPATPTASQPDPSASIWVQLHQLPPNQILPPVSGSSYIPPPMQDL